MKYPYECCRCGFCCMERLCPVAKGILPEHTRVCPYLTFDGVIASCGLAGSVVPVGDGCCIKARAYKDGVEFDFASLPPVLKHIAARDLKKKIFVNSN